MYNYPKKSFWTGQEAGVDTGEINENQEPKEPTDEDIEDDIDEGDEEEV